MSESDVLTSKVYPHAESVNVYLSYDTIIM